MVLLVTLLLSISAVSATDTNESSSVNADVQSGNETNIESNSIKTVSNEYETITNEISSSDKTLNKKSSTNNTSTKTENTTEKQKVNIQSNSIVAYANQKIDIVANVTYPNGENLSSAKTAIKINGKTIGQPRVTDGVLNFSYELPKWNAKDYNITIIVGETSTTSTSTINTTLTIQRHDVEITLKDYNVSSAALTQLKAIVKYENGTLANGTKAVYKINGKTIGSTVVENGVASITFVAPGKAVTYPLVLKIGESTVSRYNETTVNLVVNKRTPTISTDVLYFASKGNTVTLKAQLTDIGYANASGKIGFKINGKTVATVQMVNSTATYKYDVSKLKNGNHIVSIVYGGSSALYEARLNVSLRVQPDLVSYITYDEILDKANSSFSFILANNRLPNYMTINENQISMADFLYLLTQVVSYNNSFHNGGFSAPTSSASTSQYGVEINSTDYIPLAKKIVDSYIKNGYAPSSIKTNSGLSLSFNDTIYLYSRVVSFLKDNDRLPNYITLTKYSSSSSVVSTTTSTYVPTNVVPAGYESFVGNASNAYINSTIIKNAVQKAVNGVTGTYNQAVAIYNYVQSHTDYSSYLNTRLGAISTLQKGYGNCVDQAHLLLSMYRTALIPARYAHATCYFKSGLVIGHVWVEVYVNGKWYSCDTTSSQNSFNKINNWYKSSTVKRYTSLSF